MKYYYKLRDTVSRRLSSGRQKATLTAKRKKNKWKGWVSPSSTRNYVLQDLIADILKYKNVGVGNNKITQTCFILQQGNDFEERVIKLLKRSFPGKYISIHGNDLPRSYVFADQSMEAMKKGVPIIISPVFHDFKKKINGVPDLVVRSDYLAKIFKDPPPIIKGEGCKFSKDWYYVIVDIKFSTLNLRSNGVELLNSSNCKAYKSQLFLYNDYLARVQGFDPQMSYILGRTFKYSNSVDGETKGTSCFDRVGVIDYKGWDKEYPSLVKSAVKWLRVCKTIAKNFTITDIHNSRYNLYPNMCVDNLFYQADKWTIARAISDITMLPFCGPKQRAIALSNGINNWKHPKCNSKTLGFKDGSFYGEIVDACLRVNKGKKKFTIKASENYPNFAYLKNVKRENKVYLDFETINNACDDFSTMPQPSTLDIAFMASIGYFKGNKFVTETFTAQGLTEHFEYEMFQKLAKKIKKNSVVIHWGSCDKRIWTKIIKKYSINTPEPKWFDAHRAAQNNKIGIKNCFSYSLKRVTNALNDLGMVKSRFDSGDHGLEAMHQAYVANKESEGEVFIEHPYIQTLKTYNVKDVQSLYEVVTFFENLS